MDDIHALGTPVMSESPSTSPATPRRVAVSGATGMIGSDLVGRLEQSGDEVIRLIRRSPTSSVTEAQWSVEEGLVNPSRLEGVDAVVHLAGENIASGRWTEARKRRIRESRVHGTRRLCEDLAKLEEKPSVLVCASATGYYGDRGDELLDEGSPPGDGYLPEVCTAWEAATAPAAEASIRVVNLRTGVVIGRQGGALANMLLPFKLGFGGNVGNGRQWWSWIAQDDVVGAICCAIDVDALRGPVNATAPNPVTNAEFTKTLGAVLHRPTILPLPAFAAKLVLGEMAKDLLLASTRVVPQALQRAGYEFVYPSLHGCLERELSDA